MSELTDTMLYQIKAAGLPEPITEYRFDSKRKWRFDFCWFNFGKMIALEVEGGTFVKGRHTRGVGFQEDCIKYNTAQIDGWMVLRVTKAMIDDGIALQHLEAALKA